MEHKQKIDLEAGTSYYLATEDLRKMYVYLGLSKYSFLRNPNYNENLLLSLLQADFKKFTTEIHIFKKQMPNNFNLHQIIVFFEYHNKQLNLLVKQLNKT